MLWFVEGGTPTVDGAFVNAQQCGGALLCGMGTLEK